MRIVTFKKIKECTERHPDSDIPLRNWYKKVKDCEWNNFAGIKQTFNNADSIGNNRIVFNIKGNNYRLVAIVIFASRKVYIRFVGTHDEYSKITDCSII